VTPFELDILLHYYVSGADHPSMSDPPPIWRDEIEYLYAEKLLEKGVDTAHRLSDRGRVFLNYVMDLPLPQWQMPRATREMNTVEGRDARI
jgi:hypothetical protein